VIERKLRETWVNQGRHFLVLPVCFPERSTGLLRRSFAVGAREREKKNKIKVD
jgi:hypothetical protein